ncbi:hypothetical protein [Oceanisphaera sp. W20_SRM_FM3]|uniref:hypothetical protein n=1 Tax=Oceanisphaera sp. W20_SRM_FM3 TaxID=3240267 RepID=UPI003F9A8146
MLIGNTHSAVNAAYESKTNSTNNAKPPQVNQGNSVDSVNISSVGKQAAYEGVIPNVTNIASGAHPLEMYQMPSWQADYMFEATGTLGIGADWFAEKYPQAASTSMSERIEYADRVQEHYQAILDANGIRGVEAHYKATILDKNFSESLRQQMNERVQGDSKLIELMEKMGKSIT